MNCPTCRKPYNAVDVVAGPITDDERWDKLVDEAKLAADLFKNEDSAR